MSNYIIVREGELYHHGIKGQKWGVRRYENKDGTLTEEGKKRYGVANGGSGNEKLAKQYSKEFKKYNKLKDKTDINKQAMLAEKYSKRAKTAAAIAGTLGVGTLGAAGYGNQSLTRLGAELATSTARLRGMNRTLDQRYGSAKAERLFGEQLRDKMAENMRKLENIRAEKNVFGSTKYDNDPMLEARLSSNIKSFDARRKDSDSRYDKMINANEKTKELRENELAKNQNLQSKLSEKQKAMNITTAVLGGATAVTAGWAVYNAVRAKVAKQLTTEAGHSKAVQKYEKQIDRMLNMFAGTPYSEIIKQL